MNALNVITAILHHQLLLTRCLIDILSNEPNPEGQLKRLRGIEETIVNLQKAIRTERASR